MKLIILGAGYATRLYPLTLSEPKSLLSVAGKPMIEHVMNNLAPIKYIDHVYIVSNNKFVNHFQQWANSYMIGHSGVGITIINDYSTDDTNKLGAIGDLYLMLTQEQINDDIIVVAGDNLFSKRLDEFGEFCHKKNAPVLAVYDVGSLEEIKKYHAIELSNNGLITFFEEKPTVPKSTLTGIALYYYPQPSLGLIQQWVS